MHNGANSLTNVLHISALLIKGSFGLAYGLQNCMPLRRMFANIVLNGNAQLLAYRFKPQPLNGGGWIAHAPNGCCIFDLLLCSLRHVVTGMRHLDALVNRGVRTDVVPLLLDVKLGPEGLRLLHLHGLDHGYC